MRLLKFRIEIIQAAEVGDGEDVKAQIPAASTGMRYLEIPDGGDEAKVRRLLEEALCLSLNAFTSPGNPPVNGFDESAERSISDVMDEATDLWDFDES